MGDGVGDGAGDEQSNSSSSAEEEGDDDSCSGGEGGGGGWRRALHGPVGAAAAAAEAADAAAAAERGAALRRRFAANVRGQLREMRAGGGETLRDLRARLPDQARARARDACVRARAFVCAYAGVCVRARLRV